MQWLNYHHLLYFWMSAKEGSMSAAARRLRVTQPTVSGQVRSLEERCGGPLLERSGRELRLTRLGERVFAYADEIFSIGEELVAAIDDPNGPRATTLSVGVVDAVPKLVACELLRPALVGDQEVFLHVTEGPLDRLLGRLSVHELDLVLSDSPIAPHLHVRAFNHLLGESPVAVFALPQLAERLRGGFPGTLAGAPFLFPSRETMLRRSIDHWLEQQAIRVHPVAEIVDSALLKAFARAGLGAFAAPTVVAADLESAYGVERVGECEGLGERYYAISVERRIQHPAVRAIVQQAHSTLGPAAGEG